MDGVDQPRVIGALIGALRADDAFDDAFDGEATRVVSEVVGALSEVDGFTSDLAVFLIAGVSAERGWPSLPAMGVGLLLDALRSAGWLSSPRGRARLSLVEAEAHWDVAARDALRSAFAAAHPDRVRQLNEAVSDWYADQDAPARAVRYAVAAGSWPRVVAILTSNWPRLLFEHPGTLTRALRSTPLASMTGSPVVLALQEILLPSAAIRQRLPPRLKESDWAAVGRSPQARFALEVSLSAAVLLRRRGLYAQARAYDRQLDAIRSSSIAHCSTQIVGLTSLAFAQSGILSQLSGETTEAIAQLREAYRHAGVSSFQFSASDVTARLALSYAIAGDQRQSVAWLARSREAPVPRGLLARGIRGITLLAEAKIAAAQLDRERMERALGALGASLDLDECWPFVISTRANYLLTWGAPREIAAYCAQLQARPDQSVPRSMDADGSIAGPIRAAVEVNVLLALGRGNDALAILGGRYQHHAALDEPRARLALLTGDSPRARDLALTALDRTPALLPIQRLELRLIIAVASYRMGRIPQAADDLRRAVSQAYLLSVLQPFLRVPRADLLAIAERVPDTLTLLGNERLVQATRAGGLEVTLVTLSGREQFILAKLSQGLPAAAIASVLSVSINTVRSQRRTLYRKLGVTSRLQALRIAADLGLLAAPETR